MGDWHKCLVLMIDKIANAPVKAHNHSKTRGCNDFSFQKVKFKTVVLQDVCHFSAAGALSNVTKRPTS